MFSSVSESQEDNIIHTAGPGSVIIMYARQENQSVGSF